MGEVTSLPAGDGVESFNGRTGAVSPQAGDYSASDISGLGNCATKNATISTSDPSGSANEGDLWIKIT